MAVTLRNVKGTRLTHAEMDENWKSVMGGHNFLHIQDQKPQDTTGGTFTSGAWRTRDLNTVLTNTISGASLADNQITLPAGKYYVEASAPAYYVDKHQLRFTNTTSSVSIVGFGGYEYISTANWNMSRVAVCGIFNTNISSTFQLEHICSATQSSSGFGVSANFTTEVYSEIRIWRIGEYVAP